MKLYLSFVLISAFTFFSSCENKTDKTSPVNKQTPEIASPDLKTYLDTASTTKIGAVSEAVLFYQKNFLPKSPVSCDSDLVLMKNFALRVTEDLNMNNVAGEYISENGEISAETRKKFKKLGLLVEWSEGMPYFILDAGYLKKNMSKCLSSPMMAFMDEFETENENIAVEDGGIMISTKELERRLIFWDSFLSSNKNFILGEEARATYNFYLNLYTTGIDNTPAFDPFSGHLNEELKSSYTSLIKENPASKTTQFMQEYYSVLSANDFKINDDVSNYIRNKKSPY